MTKKSKKTNQEEDEYDSSGTLEADTVEGVRDDEDRQELYQLLVQIEKDVKDKSSTPTMMHKSLKFNGYDVRGAIKLLNEWGGLENIMDTETKERVFELLLHAKRKGYEWTVEEVLGRYRVNDWDFEATKYDVTHHLAIRSPESPKESTHPYSTPSPKGKSGKTPPPSTPSTPKRSPQKPVPGQKHHMSPVVLRNKFSTLAESSSERAEKKKRNSNHE